MTYLDAVGMLWECDTETYNITVANAMRRNRFEQIKKYTHCADNNNLLPDDKFAKLRPLYNLLNTRFLKYAELAENISIDECMVRCPILAGILPNNLYGESLFGMVIKCGVCASRALRIPDAI